MDTQRYEFSGQHFMLAQGSSAPPPAGEAVEMADGANNGPNTTPGGGGATSQGGPSMLNLFLIMGAVMILMMVLSTRGQKKERKRREALLAALKKHDRVQTIGGVIGTIVEVKDAEVVVKIDETTNTKMRFARSAIQQVLEDKQPVDVIDRP